MNHSQTPNLRRMIFISLFTAFIIIGGYISFPIPFSPAPIVLADFFVMLTGLTLGASGGASSIGLFLLLGVLGLPVFAGGEAGLAVFVGPKGGFLWGYLACAFIVGIISTHDKPSWVRDLVALITGNIFLYTLGTIGLKMVLKVTWDKALFMSVVPFMPGMIIKVIASIALIRTIRPIIKSKQL